MSYQLTSLDILPIIFAALESPTPVLVGAALQCLPSVLPVLDFSTIKNELFPVVAMIFSKTNSLAIKVRGLQAFVVLCGGSTDPLANNDGLDGLGPSERKPSSSSSALDKFTMQEKIVPLIKAIKTKEPAVMIAALNVLRIVGKAADAEFVAMEILPILWAMSLTPLLDLKQFQSFMDLIKSLSKRVEDEQTRKLQELNGGNTSGPAEDFMSLGGLSSSSALDTNGTSANDFAALVGGGGSNNTSNASPLDSGGWDDALTSKPAVTSPGIRSGTGTGRSTPTATFSWSSAPPANTAASSTTLKPQTTGSNFRTVTPDLGSFQALTPQSTQFSQPLQPTPSAVTSPTGTGINWGTATQAQSNPWSSSTPTSTVTSPSIAPPTNAFGGMNLGQLSNTNRTSSSFSLQPPPSASSVSTPGFGSGIGGSGFSLAPPPKPPTVTSGPSWGSGSGSGSGSSLGNLGSLSSLNNGGNSLGGMMAAKNTSSFGGMGSGMGSGMSMGSMMQPLQPQSSGWGTPLQPQQAQPQQQQNKSGLDKYESLL